MLWTFEKILKPLRRKVRQLVTRGLITLVNPDKQMQLLQVQLLNSEVLDNVEHFELYGFTAHPQTGAEILAVSLNGQRSHTLAAIVADRRYRIQSLAAGEVAISTDEGDVIHFKRNNEILINTANKLTVVASNQVNVSSPLVNVVASTKVTLDTPNTELTGALNVTGLITGQAGMAISGGSGASINGNLNVTAGNIAADGIDLKTHTHPGDSGGTTGAPQ